MAHMNLSVQMVSSCPFAGGAARAAFRLHEALDGASVISRWLDAGGSAVPSRPDITTWARPNRLYRRLLTRLKGRVDPRERLRSFVGCTTHTTWPEGWGDAKRFASLPTPDIWHLHWVGSFLDWPSALPAMARRAPIIWTLHDLNPTQGVWHYDPYSNEKNALRTQLDDQARIVKYESLKAISPERLTFVAPSRWMADRCRSSPLTEHFTTVHIPYGIDSEIFSPMCRQAARHELGLAPKVPVLGFVAENLTDRRKGMTVLQAALELLAVKQPVMLLTVGKGEPSTPNGVERVNLGPVYEDHMLRLFYSACDAFVCPSLQDNLPNTVLEAMACGTAVVGSDTGGIPDMVQNGDNGWLAAPDDAGALAEALNAALADAGRLAYAGQRARAKVLTEYTLHRQAERYAELYRRLAQSGLVI